MYYRIYTVLEMHLKVVSKLVQGRTDPRVLGIFYTDTDSCKVSLSITV